LLVWSPGFAAAGEGIPGGRRFSLWSGAMSAEFDLTDADFARVVAAFDHLRLGTESPPFLRDFLVLRLREHDPGLADRVASATDEQVERLLDRVRLHQISPE
jgi:hypothetical protein